MSKYVLSIFCFSEEYLSFYDIKKIRKFINIFSLIPGTVNKNLNSVGDYNAVDSNPIIIIGKNYYFLPTSFNLARSIYESPFYWMGADDNYKDISFENRGKATEIISYELLKDVFGKENTFKNVKIYKNKKEVTDIDALAIAGNKAIIVQAKSKKLTELSRKGDDIKLRDDFQGAVQKAYNQALKSRNAIIDKNSILISEYGKKLELIEFIDDAYIICITSDNYPAVLQQVDAYLQKKDNEPYPLAMNIFDLELLSFYLRDPFDFLYYIRQRVSLSNYFKSTSEITFLGCHLNRKLLKEPGYDLEMIDESYSQLIDANFPALKGYNPITSATDRLKNKWKNENFQKIMEQIKNTKIPGFTDAIFFLSDLAEDSADKLISTIENTKIKTSKDSQMHDFSMTFKNGKYGVSFITIPTFLKGLKENLSNLCVARKYKTRADVWLGLGKITGSFNYMDVIVFIKNDWVEDTELEKFSKKILKKGTLITMNGKKVGRNNPCPCGSGEKYKKCCGR